MSGAMGITKDQRMRSWNVEFVVGIRTVAGVFQLDDLLSVADVSRELDLCLQFSQPQGDWQAVLLPMETSPLSTARPGDARHTEGHVTIDNEPFILLDKADSRLFPSPPTGYCTRYWYAFHSTSCSNEHNHTPLDTVFSNPRHPFPYRDACIRQAATPKRRSDPRYLPINKRCQDERLRCVRLRNARGIKRKSSSDSGRAQSQAWSSSRATSDVGVDISSEEVPLEIISPDDATYIMSKFRTNVLTGTDGSKCVISGKGESWLGGGIPGPGLQAAHIVPHCHWNTYPQDEDQRVADRDVKSQLEQAWRQTWASSNGLPLLSHLHTCFEARLVSIHPTTRRIRAFARFDVLTDFHGKTASTWRGVDPNALQHHWDLCCLENMVATGIPDVQDGSSTAPLPAVPNSIADSGLISSPAASDRPAPGPGDSRGASGQPQAGPGNSSVVDAGLGIQTLSPPSSDIAGKSKEWIVGNEVIKDPKLAERLRSFGWNVRELLHLGLPPEEERVPGERRDRSLKRRRRSSRCWKIGAKVIEDEFEAQRLQDQGWIIEEVHDDSDECARGRGKKRR